MAASSVTGVSGPGDSKGKYKPENNCSCSCCCGNEKKELVNKNKKLGCYKKYSNYSKTIKNTTGSKLKIKIC